MSFVPGFIRPVETATRPLWFLVNPLAHEAQVIVHQDGNQAVLPGVDELRGLGLDPAESHFLGRLDGRDCYALSIGSTEPAAPLRAVGLRSLFGQLGEELFGLAGRAVQIVNFHATHRFCGRCAGTTHRHAEELCVECQSCGLVCYPRISPAIIVLVRRGKDALLARSARVSTGFFSALAGFVEVGESLEETLRREVREEVGIDVTNLRYFGSQPWPFPHSLMVGFTAEHAGGEIMVDEREIAEAKWFSADALPMLPPRKVSIARELIDAWIAEVSGG